MEIEARTPARGELRIMDGKLYRFIERELEGDKWEPLDLPAAGHTQSACAVTRPYRVDFSQDGPGGRPRYCLGQDSVGHVPTAWFYRKEDAERVAALLNAEQAA